MYNLGFLIYLLITYLMIYDEVPWSILASNKESHQLDTIKELIV